MDNNKANYILVEGNGLGYTYLSDERPVAKAVAIDAVAKFMHERMYNTSRYVAHNRCIIKAFEDLVELASYDKDAFHAGFSAKLEHIAKLEQAAREAASYTNEQAEELLKKLFSED